MHDPLVVVGHPTPQKASDAFRGFALPTSNTTYCPNQFFDVCLPNSSRGCVRLVAYLLRKTLGWSDEHGRPQVERHRVSYQELITKAGISRDMIRSAIDDAIGGHFVVQVQLGRPNSAGIAVVSALYELQWDEGAEYVKDPKRFRGFFAGEGNRTYIPNQFFDRVVRHETLAVVKVVGSVIRFSIGFQTKWGHRRQVISLSYQDIQNYAHIGDRKTLAAAIRASLQRNYLQRVEEGRFDPDAGRLSRPATYAVKWLNDNAVEPNGRKTLLEKLAAKNRSENPTGNGRKTPPGERSEIPTDIQITTANNTSKQQHDSAVAFSRLREEGFDARAAKVLASKFALERVERQIAWLDQRHVKSNRLGMLRAAIEEDWSAPVPKGKGPRQLGRPNSTPNRASGASFADALKQAEQRLIRPARPRSSSSASSSTRT